MEIVENCKGIPLALKAIGRVLFQRTEADWLRVKNNVHRYLTQQEDGIIPILKLSYDNLSLHLGQCFAYCSLIPKDTIFFTMHDLACFVVETEYHISNLKVKNVDERTPHVSFEDQLNSSWEIPNTLLKATRVKSLIPLSGCFLNLIHLDCGHV
ncbi:disease resistance protein RGA2-like [Gossypium australe]|uniref:Disease resistance protein RGA2-like n=1 Tax=Gossypium australe TaxID=47621 RepID=A0A5B6WFI5_9ROSI|nr:disease resistance protein RGA2-like [Gossypium australe]